jgi:hypothetical protein
MATMNDDGQWIILMAFIICVALFFLAVVVNESTIVGRTTAESVLDFSKSDIQDLRDQVFEWKWKELEQHGSDYNNSATDVEVLAMSRQNVLINITTNRIHFNNGVTEYNAEFQTLF